MTEEAKAAAAGAAAAEDTDVIYFTYIEISITYKIRCDETVRFEVRHNLFVSRQDDNNVVLHDENCQCWYEL